MTEPWRSFGKVFKRRWNCRRRLPAQFDEYKAWLSEKKASGPAINGETYRGWLVDHPDGTIGNFFSDIVAQTSSLPEVVLDAETAALENPGYWPSALKKLHIKFGPGRNEITIPENVRRIENVVIESDWELIEKARERYRRPIRLSNCWIETVEIKSEARVRLTLRSCYVRRLLSSRNAFHDLELDAGLLLAFEAPVSHDRSVNPFRGRVTFRDLYLPRDFSEVDDDQSRSGRAMAAYEFRNITAHLTERNEVAAAGIFHSAQLALERDDDPLLTRCIGWLYEVMGDYGNSLARPAASLLVIIISMSGLGYSSGIKLQRLETGTHDVLPWWEKFLEGDSFWNELWRSFVYALQTIFNPLNVFAPQSKFAVTSGAVWFVLTTLGLFGTLAVALFAFALRRRFKIQ